MYIYVFATDDDFHPPKFFVVTRSALEFTNMVAANDGNNVYNCEFGTSRKSAIFLVILYMLIAVVLSSALVDTSVLLT